MKTKEQLRAQILELVSEFHPLSFPESTFIPGKTTIPVSGKVFDAADMAQLVDASLDFWLTTGRFAAKFQSEFASRVGVRGASLVNSGSSANLCAVSALTSPALGTRRLRPGDEVITVAAGFPTTVNPIVQNRLVPVFVDVTLHNYDIDVNQLEDALSSRTKAIIVAHTLGNPFDLDSVTAFAKKHGLWLIEDCCDALGSKYQGRNVGTFGDMATVSFYPAHQITMGEGGCVLTARPNLTRIVESFRDWGRDCWCDPGKTNTCGKRFEWDWPNLPEHFDHKYVYSHVGYNLKLTDMQAAVGLSQLGKLDSFIAARKENFQALYDGMKPFESEFMLPKATQGSEPSWFGFPVGVRPGSRLSRAAVIERLEERKIATRLLFAADITRQPAYKDVEYRKIGSLENTRFVVDNVFWIGVYPGISRQMIDYMISCFADIVREPVLSTTS
jgi:CDP-6-deoxy-D-xylo-4-hexulose-3-dehydrase